MKRFIFFSFDPNRRSVVIGPVITSGKSGKALRALEHGGTVTLPSGNKATIAPRPFMGPAFEKEAKELPSLWASVIK